MADLREGRTRRKHPLKFRNLILISDSQENKRQNVKANITNSDQSRKSQIESVYLWLLLLGECIFFSLKTRQVCIIKRDILQAL